MGAQEAFLGFFAAQPIPRDACEHEQACNHNDDFKQMRQRRFLDRTREKVRKYECKSNAAPHPCPFSIRSSVTLARSFEICADSIFPSSKTALPFGTPDERRYSSGYAAVTTTCGPALGFKSHALQKRTLHSGWRVVQIHLMSFQRRHARESFRLREAGSQTLLLLHDQFTCSCKELQPNRKSFGTERLTIDYPRPHITPRAIEKDTRIRRPRPFGKESRTKRTDILCWTYLAHEWLL